MKVALLTDAWKPQINGVVTTLGKVCSYLQQDGHELLVIHPGLFRTVPMPGYKEIRLALFPYSRVEKLLDDFSPDAIHVSTEGPIGLAGRKYCLRRKRPFTTSYHTRFPEYLRMRAPVPVRFSHAWLRHFHAPASRTLVPTPSIRDELSERGYRHLTIWGRGVDTALFRPLGKDFLDLPRPIMVYTGRVAVEKSIEDFLRLDLPGTRLVIGDGPALPMLKQKYPDAVFTGYLQGEALVRHMAAGDVFVFPSRTDTFGIVMLEAMACGLPVAAYPVPGPRDVVIDGQTGALDSVLEKAVGRALTLDSQACIDHARARDWASISRQFFELLEPDGRSTKQAEAKERPEAGHP